MLFVFHSLGMIMSDNSSNIALINSALKTLSVLRTSANELFHQTLELPQLNSMSDYEQAKTKNLQAVVAMVEKLDQNFTMLDEQCNNIITNTQSSLHLGNTQLVGLDTNYDKTTLYPDLVLSYRWLDNVAEYSTLALQALATNTTKRSTILKNQRQRIRINANNHNVSPQQIDYLVALQQKTIKDVEIARPFGLFNVLKVNIDRTLRAVIVMRGFIIEWVLIKGFDETFDELNNNNLSANDRRMRHSYSAMLNDDPLDVWTPSRHLVFRTITEHANAAILHFYAPFSMENAIKAYLNWLRSYATLFTAPCRKCAARLLNNMPPTWRDFRTNEPFHFECRP